MPFGALGLDTRKVLVQGAVVEREGVQQRPNPAGGPRSCVIGGGGGMHPPPPSRGGRALLRDDQGCIGRGGRLPPPPLQGHPAYAQPLSP